MYFLIILESLKFGALLRNPAITFYVMSQFFHILLSFVFHLQKDFYGIHNDTGGFFLFLLQKDFDIFHKLLFAFFSFLERFNICFYSLDISATEFSSLESSLSHSLAEIYISLIIYLGIFFSLTTCLHSSKKAWR